MEPEEQSEGLKQLMSIGKARGYVLYEEIDSVLAPGREGLVELDAILSELTRHAVEVIDEPRTEDSIPDDNFFNQEEFRNPGDWGQIKVYLREILTIPHLTSEQEKELAKQISDGGNQAELAEKRLIEANLWIAVGTAMHFMNRGLSPLDLIQESNIGVMRAVKEYNYLRQYRFSTYAIWWTRRAIQVALHRIERP